MSIGDKDVMMARMRACSNEYMTARDVTARDMTVRDVTARDGCTCLTTTVVSFTDLPAAAAYLQKIAAYFPETGHTD